ncbi:MAG: hypothetical protein Q9222_005474 [Ikaeria aurantiellina]
MPEILALKSGKRHHADEPDTSAHQSKKQRIDSIQDFQYPSAFWDYLSQIHLTKDALAELDWRNLQTLVDFHESPSISRRPFTRSSTRRLGGAACPSPIHEPNEYLQYCGPMHLSLLKRAARHGGLDLSDLVGFPEPSNPPARAMGTHQPGYHIQKQTLTPTSSSKTSGTTGQTEITGPYHQNFEQHLTDFAIYPEDFVYPDDRDPPLPTNMEDIQRKLSLPRRSLSPSSFTEEDFYKFNKIRKRAKKGKQVLASVIPIIEGNLGDAKCESKGTPFNNLEPLTDGMIMSGNPDACYGSHPQTVNRQVRQDLSKYIAPSTQDDLPVAPNFLLRVKGLSGTSEVALR